MTTQLEVRPRLYLAAFLTFVLLLGCRPASVEPTPTQSTAAVGVQTKGAPRFVRDIGWSGSGRWLKADTHVHTRFSDGASSVAEVVRKAREFGVDVIAITDHLDSNLRAATPEYAEAILAARRENPGMIILAGGEWNIPPWGGDEHGTVLVPPCPNDLEILAEFKKRFDDLNRETHDAALALEALRWLEQHGTVDGLAPVVIYNHPTRMDANADENVPDMEAWRSVNDLVIGFEGAPGHQGVIPIGSYKYGERPLDRWDPVAARIGSAWDQLLQRGYQVWAALASSDFHQVADYWPGQFSETWLYVDEPTPAGVLRALRAGSFFATHGHIARGVRFTVEVEGLPRRVEAGEVVEVAPGSQLKVCLEMAVPETDWQGQPNRIDEIELIAITLDKTEVIVKGPPETEGPALSHAVTVPPSGIVLRARGRRVIEGADDLMFYTNPIRVKAAKP